MCCLHLHMFQVQIQMLWGSCSDLRRQQLESRTLAAGHRPCLSVSLCVLVFHFLRSLSENKWQKQKEDFFRYCLNVINLSLAFSQIFPEFQLFISVFHFISVVLVDSPVMALAVTTGFLFVFCVPSHWFPSSSLFVLCVLTYLVFPRLLRNTLLINPSIYTVPGLNNTQMSDYSFALGDYTCSQWLCDSAVSFVRWFS